MIIFTARILLFGDRAHMPLCHKTYELTLASVKSSSDCSLFEYFASVFRRRPGSLTGTLLVTTRRHRACRLIRRFSCGPRAVRRVGWRRDPKPHYLAMAPVSRGVSAAAGTSPLRCRDAGVGRKLYRDGVYAVLLAVDLYIASGMFVAFSVMASDGK